MKTIKNIFIYLVLYVVMIPLILDGIDTISKLNGMEFNVYEDWYVASYIISALFSICIANIVTRIDIIYNSIKE